MAEFNLTGLGVALATPFKMDYSIDFEALERLIDHIVMGGADYIVVMGTTAETPTLAPDERIILTDFVRQKTDGRLPLVIGIGGNCTQRVIQDLKERNLLDYSAILSVTPYYNKPTQEGLYQHYKAISEASPLPIILYNVPGRTGVNLSAKTTLALSEIDNIIAIKEASGKIDQIQDIIDHKPDGFHVISGNDADTCALMRIGAEGLISVLGNAFPGQIKRLVDMCASNNFDDGQILQERMKELIRLLFAEGNPAGVKFACHELGLIENVLRLPLVPVSNHTANEIKSCIKDFVKLSWE